MNEKKSLNPEGRKMKKIVLISVGVFLLLTLGGTGLYFYLNRNTTPPLSDADFLVDVGTWEKQGSPKVKWIFKKDGAGTLTTNESNFYDFTWELSGEELKISTDWLYTLEDDFSFSLNREEKTFTVVAKSDNKESVFIQTTGNSSSENQEQEE